MTDQELRVKALELACNIEPYSANAVPTAREFLAFLTGVPLDAVIPTIEQLLAERATETAKVRTTITCVPMPKPEDFPSKPRRGASAVAKIAATSVPIPSKAMQMLQGAALADAKPTPALKRLMAGKPAATGKRGKK